MGREFWLVSMFVVWMKMISYLVIELPAAKDEMNHVGPLELTREHRGRLVILASLRLKYDIQVNFNKGTNGCVSVCKALTKPKTQEKSFFSHKVLC